MAPDPSHNNTRYGVAALFDFPQLVVEAGFSVGADLSAFWHIGDPERGQIGFAALSADSNWVDITPFVQHLAITAGTSSRVTWPTVQWEAGTCRIDIDNSGGEFDPNNTASPYYPDVKSGVAIRVRAKYGFIPAAYPLFQGLVDAWEIGYPNKRGVSTITAACTDGTKIAAQNPRPAVALVGANEATGTRVARILNSFGWPATDRILAAGDSNLQATDLSGDAWSELQAVAEAEAGDVYVDTSGRFVFANRHSVYSDSRRTTSQATFGDDVAGGDLPIWDVQVSYDDDMLFNNIGVTIDGGTRQTVSDSTSITRYMQRSVEKTGLKLFRDGDARDYAGWLLLLCKDPEFRFDRITVRPRRDPTNTYPVVLSLAYLDRITVTMTPPGLSSPVTKDCFIRGISHSIDPRGVWETSYELQSATKYAFPWTLGDSTLGRIGLVPLGF